MGHRPAAIKAGQGLAMNGARRAFVNIFTKILCACLSIVSLTEPSAEPPISSHASFVRSARFVRSFVRSIVNMKNILFEKYSETPSFVTLSKVRKAHP